MLNIDSIRAQIAAWRQRWPHLALVLLEVHPAIAQAIGVMGVDGLPLEAAPWMTHREYFYFLYRRGQQARPRRIRDD